MALLLSFLIIVLLVAANALYVAAEFAAVGVRKTRIAGLAEQGNYLARSLTLIVSSPQRLDRYVATCQIGITISSLVLGAYGQGALAKVLSPHLERFVGGAAAAQGLAAIAVLICLTIFQMVLGELVPKTLALQFPTQVSLATVLPMGWSQVILSPFITFLNGSGNLVLRLFGQAPGSHRHIHSPEEIALMIGDTVEAGLLGAHDEKRLQRVFRLSTLNVSQIMTPRSRVEAIPADAPLEEVTRRLATSQYTRLPVYREDLDDLVGILHTKDYLRAMAAGNQPVCLADILHPVVIVPKSLTCNDLLKRMREEHSSYVLVIDEYGGTAGIATLDDVLSVLLGGISDEYKQVQVPVEPLPDGSFRIAGHAHLLDLEDAIGCRWSGNSTTASGLIVETLGHVPKPGEQLEIQGCQVEILVVKGTLVEKFIVRPTKKEPA
jgi:putative hemolysin